MEPAVYGCEDNKIISNIVMFRLKTLTILGSKAELASLPEGKLLINTVNAHSFNTAKKDQLFADAPGIKHLFFYFAEDSRKAIPYFMLDSKVWEEIKLSIDRYLR